MKDTSPNAPTTYLVGRSIEADIVVSDPTVSRLHAELVRSTNGTWYLTDRCSTGGTHVLDGGDWIPIEQDFVQPGDRLRLGGFECTLDELLRRLPAGPGDGAAVGARAMGDISSGGTTVGDDRPSGAVIRKPDTGEIVPKEDD